VLELQLVATMTAATFKRLGSQDSPRTVADKMWRNWSSNQISLQKGPCSFHKVLNSKQNEKLFDLFILVPSKFILFVLLFCFLGVGFPLKPRLAWNLELAILLP
jgi:hypothetical protein